ncbi:MAG: hypothetical protein Kow00129_06650 [Thermoleophilia bacterium]
MDLVLTTKPRVVLLFIVTAWAGYALAGASWAPALLPLSAGLAACVGGAGALNNYLERSRDARMPRTQNRPLPAGRVSPRAVWSLGTGLIAAGAVILLVGGGAAAALLALAGAAYYVLVYTVFLKPRYAHSAVPGGLAGLFPPLVGWAYGLSVTGGPAPVLPLVYLVGVIFLWSPPHFWALTLVRRTDYLAADIPVPPNHGGPQLTRLQMLSYALCLFGLSLLPGATGLLGHGYLLAAGISGLVYAGTVFAAVAARSPSVDKAVYKLSGPYLAVLLAGMALDAGRPARVLSAAAQQFSAAAEKLGSLG